MTRVPFSRPSRVLLLGLIVCSASGCLMGAPEEAPSPPVTSAAPTGHFGPKVALFDPIPEAHFVVQGEDLRSPEWPDSYTGYTFLVCNPSLPAEDVQRIHRDLPGALALAYFNLQDLHYAPFLDNPYWAAFDAVFDTTLCVRDRPTGRVLRVAGYTGEPGSGSMQMIPHARNIEILVAFHRDVTMSAGWDGLYLDQSEKVYPPWRRAAVQSQSTDFDADADGVQDTMSQLAAKWATGRAVLTSRLRQELGHAAYLVANTAGPLGDHNVNGITLEGVGTLWTVGQAKLFLLDQKRVAHQPFVAAGWVLSRECVAATRSLALQVPGTCYGRIPELYP